MSRVWFQELVPAKWAYLKEVFAADVSAISKRELKKINLEIINGRTINKKKITDKLTVTNCTRHIAHIDGFVLNALK